MFDTSALLLVHQDFLVEALGLVNETNPIINVFLGEKYGEVAQDLLNRGFIKPKVSINYQTNPPQQM